MDQLNTKAFFFFKWHVLFPLQDGSARLSLDFWRLETGLPPEISGFMGPRSETFRDQEHQWVSHIDTDEKCKNVV